MSKHLLLSGTILILVTHLNAQIKYLEFMKKEPETFHIKMAVCNRTSHAPVVDGVLDDKAWDTAFKMKDFANTINQEAIQSHQQTTAWVTHDSQFLYFAFSCEEDEMDRVRAETFRYDDSDILFDDRIEIFLDVGHNHKELIRLVVNSNGVTYDTKVERPVQYAFSCIKGDDRWNTEWRAKTRKYDDRWTAEVAIAMDRIYPGEIEPGTTWGFNLIRDRHAQFYFGPRHQKGEMPSTSQQLTAWQPVFGFVKGLISDRWLEPNGYADLVFDQNKLKIKQLSFHEAYANYNGSIWHKPQFFGDNPLQMKLANQSEKSLDIQITTSTLDYNYQRTAIKKDHTLLPNSEIELTTKIPLRADDRQQFFVQITSKADNSVLYQTSYDTRVPPFVEFDLSALYAKSKKNRGSIEVAPVVVPGTMKDCRLTLELKRKGSLESIVIDELKGLKETEFVPCLTDLDPASLAAGDYLIACQLHQNGETIGKFNHQFSVHRKKRIDSLYASDTVYSYGGMEGKATVVNFPDGNRFAFWEHASYIPWWDLDNMAVTYEFVESWGYGNMGCSEPMQDKENRYSKVDIIENTPARVVLLWRYALGDPNYQIIFNEWVHEYYYFYPDGSGVREIQLWANSHIHHEILQPQYVFPTGVIPEQMFEDTACTVFNLKGEYTVNLLDKPVFEHPKFAQTWEEEVMRIYLKNRKHPYLVWSKRKDIVPNSINYGLVQGDVRRSMGGHWPLQPINVDVYSVVGTESPYHSWLGYVWVAPDPEKQPNRWIHLIGITDRSNDHLITIGKNWLNPASIRTAYSGCRFIEFDEKQKAFIFKQEKSTQKIRFSFSGVEEKTIHPVIIVKDCTQSVQSIQIGKKVLKEGDYKTGSVLKNDEPQQIIWINQEIDPDIPVTILFTKS